MVEVVDISAPSRLQAIRDAKALDNGEWLDSSDKVTQLEIATLVGYGFRGYCKI